MRVRLTPTVRRGLPDQGQVAAFVTRSLQALLRAGAVPTTFISIYPVSGNPVLSAHDVECPNVARTGD